MIRDPRLMKHTNNMHVKQRVQEHAGDDRDFTSLSGFAELERSLASVPPIDCLTNVIGSSWDFPDIRAMEYPCSMLIAYETTLHQALETVSDQIRRANG